MKVAVYGTLKKGYGNNWHLRDANLLKEDVVHGYKLYNSGFPVACPADGCAITVEVYEFDDEATLVGMDRLEGYRGVGQHNMYDRIEVTTESGEDCHMYVGGSERWPFERMPECPNENNLYTWSR